MKKINVFAVALAMSFTACTDKEELVVPEGESINSITAEFAQPVAQSRVMIGELQNGNYPLSWAKGDLITVFDSEGTNATFYYKGESKATKGIFVKDSYYASRKLKDVSYAIANVEAEGIWKNTFVFNASDQGGESYSTRGGVFPMYGAWNNETGTLQFYPVLGFLKMACKKGTVLPGDKLVFSCDDNHSIADENSTIKLTDGKPETARLAVDNQYGVKVRDIYTSDQEFLIPLPPQNYGSFQMYVKRRYDVGEQIIEYKTPVKKITSSKGEIVIDKKIYSIGVLDFGQLTELAPAQGETISWDRVEMGEWSDVTIK